MTFDDLVEEYLFSYARHNKRTWRDDQRIFKKYWSPIFGKKHVSKITKSQVLSHLKAEMNRGLGASVNRQLAAIRGMYNWAIKQGFCEKSPCNEIDPPAKEQRSERFFKMGEYTTIFEALSSVDGPEAVKIAFTMLAYTGARRSEVVRAKWTSVDLIEDSWDITKDDSKNGKGRSIPLCPQLVAILKGWKESCKDADIRSTYLFPARWDDGKHMHPNNVNHLVLRLKEACPDLEDWHTHVLRKSAGTHLRRLKTDWETLKMILGHTRSADVTTRYDFYDGAEEKREAMCKWGEELTKYIQG